MTDVGEFMAERLREELPGFEARATPRLGDQYGLQKVIIRGLLPIYAGVHVEMMTIPVPERERMALHLVEQLVVAARQEAIKATGLDKEMDARVKAAFEEGRKEGFGEGARHESYTHAVEYARNLELEKQQAQAAAAAVEERNYHDRFEDA